jgi:limonene-1,2-epoxide hydrolase
MSENTKLIEEFCKAWSRLDPAELAGYFAEDGVYHNMPTGPVKGRQQIEEFIRGFAASWTQTDWEILTLAETRGVVIAERVDRTKAGDKSVDLPCTGIFEIRDGKIGYWRDYFDLGTYVRAIVHADIAVTEIAAVELADGLLSVAIVHLDEAEATRATRVAIGDDGCGLNLADGREQVSQIGFSGSPGQISNIDLLHESDSPYSEPH